MYEVESKVELTKDEVESLQVSLEKNDFPHIKTTQQNDFYVEAKKSQYGGRDLKRYRDEGEQLFYTEKIWDVVDGNPVRKETEREVSRTEFDSAIQKFPDAVKIKKERKWFVAVYRGQKISVIIDSVKFDHSSGVRYFVEAEIDTSDKTKVTETKEIIRDFLKGLLGKNEIIEAPGMFALAFDKL
jgi:predicted adenylyl cyclase CyaB